MDGGDLAPEDLERASTAIRYLSSLRLPSTSSGLLGLSGGALFLVALAVAILLSGVDLVAVESSSRLQGSA